MGSLQTVAICSRTDKYSDHVKSWVSNYGLFKFYMGQWKLSTKQN